MRVLVFLAHHKDAHLGFNDAPYYSETAQALADGRWFEYRGGPASEHGPLTAIVLAPASWMDAPLNWQRLVTILTGVITIAVIGLAARRLAGERAGITAAALAATYPGLWLNDGVIMSESVGGLMVATWLLIALGSRWHTSLHWAFLLGLVAGAATLARSELGVLAIAAVVGAWRVGTRGRSRRAVAAALGSAVLLVPWTATTLVRLERPVLLTTNLGTTLRGANCDEAYWGRATGSWVLPCLAGDPEVVGLEPSVRSEIWRDEGVRYARDHAGRLPVVVAARVGRTLDVYGLDYLVDEDVRDGRPRWGSWASVASFWVLAPLAALGVRRSARFARWALCAPFAAVAVTAVAFYGGHRLRVAMEPTIVLGAAVALVHMVDAVRERRRPGARGRDAEPVSHPVPVPG
ncbi:MAG TPA: glycosyltransferase family 39 protein [Acidimicrobiales bacterium]